MYLSSHSARLEGRLFKRLWCLQRLQSQSGHIHGESRTLAWKDHPRGALCSGSLLVADPGVAVCCAHSPSPGGSLVSPGDLRPFPTPLPHVPELASDLMPAGPSCSEDVDCKRPERPLCAARRPWANGHSHCRPHRLTYS